jgi:predicted outer membrane protein
MKKLLLTLAAAGVASAVVASRRRQRQYVAPLVPDEWRTDPDAYFDRDPINTRNAGAGLDLDDDLDDVDAARQALGLLRTIDEQEIEAAEDALERTDLATDVAEYAEMLLSHHSENLAAAQALRLEPFTSPEVSDFAERRAERLQALDGIEDDEEFASAYVQAMVEGHEQSLAMLDRLLPDAVDEDARDYIAGSRRSMAQHLQRGRELLERRGSPQQ